MAQAGKYSDHMAEIKKVHKAEVDRLNLLLEAKKLALTRDQAESREIYRGQNEQKRPNGEELDRLKCLLEAANLEN